MMADNSFLLLFIMLAKFYTEVLYLYVGKYKIMDETYVVQILSKIL